MNLEIDRIVVTYNRETVAQGRVTCEGRKIRVFMVTPMGQSLEVNMGSAKADENLSIVDDVRFQLKKMFPEEVDTLPIELK